MAEDVVLFEGDTKFAHYLVVDTLYTDRPARVLFSGTRQAAQSGVAKDDKEQLLFDYNERFMELVRGLRPERLLLIGGGAFTLPLALQTAFPDMMLDVVELDGELLDIAKAYFNFRPARHTRVHIDEGQEFLKTSPELYDLILVDAFMHDIVPQTLQTIKVARDLARHLRPDGVVAMNIITGYYGERSALLHRELAALRQAFSAIMIFPASIGQSLWIPQNLVLVAQNGHREIASHVRYEALALPDIDDELPDRLQS
jgi:spermidine synthase